MKLFSYTLICLLLAFQVQAKIRLNISIVYKKGIDKGLVLVSELHSVEDVDQIEQAKLVMKNGLTVLLSADFVADPDDYGPSDLVKLDGKIFIRDRQLKDTFFEKDIFIHLGEEKVLVYQDDQGQLIEITVVPEVR